MSLTIQRTPWFSFLSTRGPWAGSEGEAGFDRLFPGEGITGGEGKQEWGLKGSKAHHRVVLGCGERLGGGGSMEQGGSAAEKNGGGGAPVRTGLGEMVWELREGEADLVAG